MNLIEGIKSSLKSALSHAVDISKQGLTALQRKRAEAKLRVHEHM